MEDVAMLAHLFGIERGETRWMDRALCKGDGGNTFFPEPPRTPNKDERQRYEAEVAFAQSICQGCPVKDKCLKDAAERGEVQGIWGGVNFYISSHDSRRGLKPRTLEELGVAS